MKYHKISGELLILGDELYRFNCEQGRFMKSVESGGKCFGFSETNGMLCVGGEKLNFFDWRNRKSVKVLNVESESLDFHENGINFVVGNDKFIKVCDLRMENEIYRIEKGCDEVRFNKDFLCVRNKNVCVFDKQNEIGKIDGEFLCFDFDGGLFFVGGEGGIKSFFNENVGLAPQWCSNLNN